MGANRLLAIVVLGVALRLAFGLGYWVDQPLTRDELVRLAGERRMVKAQTILLNLQDRSRFKRTEDGGYTLV